MKVLLFAFLICNSISVLKKKKENSQLNSQQSLDAYIDSLFEKIKDYKKSQQGIVLAWSEALSFIAKTEVEKIISENDFGEHSRFSQWVDLAPNDYFTEISLSAVIKKLPTAEEFAEVYSLD